MKNFVGFIALTISRGKPYVLLESLLVRIEMFRKLGTLGTCILKKYDM